MYRSNERLFVMDVALIPKSFTFTLQHMLGHKEWISKRLAITYENLAYSKRP